MEVCHDEPVGAALPTQSGERISWLFIINNVIQTGVNSNNDHPHRLNTAAQGQQLGPSSVFVFKCTITWLLPPVWTIVDTTCLRITSMLHQNNHTPTVIAPVWLQCLEPKPVDLAMLIYLSWQNSWASHNARFELNWVYRRHQMDENNAIW